MSAVQDLPFGSGTRFSDDIIGMRDIGANNAGRIERWRKSVSYEYWATVRGTVFKF